jgi:hypothetical protein
MELSLHSDAGMINVSETVFDVKKLHYQSARFLYPNKSP